MKPHIVDFLKYLESRDNKKVPLVAKLLHPNKFGPLTEEDLTVKGNLDLSKLSIRSLPDNLTVEGDLYVQDLRILYLPNNLKIRGYLFIPGTSLPKRTTPEEIKQEIEQKGGYVKRIGLW